MRWSSSSWARARAPRWSSGLAARAYPLDLTAVRLAALVERVRAPIEALDLERSTSRISFDDAAARELYDRLLRPIAAQLGSRVAVVADGELASLPLECLVESGERGARSARRPFAELGALHFAAQDRAFVQFPSARLVARSHGAGTATGTLVLTTSAERGFGSVADELRSLRERRSETQGAWVELRDPSSSELLLGSARWITSRRTARSIASIPRARACRGRTRAALRRASKPGSSRANRSMPSSSCSRPAAAAKVVTHPARDCSV